jgi:D-alanyl-D-alanine carboxypeptidase/D-alanyl-D-alanine-endopeptidase (penicillin-binding protein 4)
MPLALAASCVLVATGLSSPAAASSETATVTASASVIVFGETVELAAGVEGDASCLGPREAGLQRAPSGSETWTTIATGATATDGSVAFIDSPQYTGRYRVSLPANGPCEALVSPPAEVRVRALIDAELDDSSPVAGSCVDLDLSVAPNKAGQGIEVQRRGESGWTTAETLTLDSDSAAAAHPCFRWEDIGIVRLRARWHSQDELNATGVGPVLLLRITKAQWMLDLDRTISGRSVSVSVGDDGAFLYQHDDTEQRTPASNEKLLLSMTLLDELGSESTIPTYAAAHTIGDGVITGNLWILGRGDPGITHARMAQLAQRIAGMGIKKVSGRVMGSTGYFRRDWWARGWRPDFRREEIPLPTALTFDENVAGGVHITNPERRAAESLTSELERRGISVGGEPGAGLPPSHLTTVATIRSSSLSRLLARMNRPSDNFYAEVLGKLLGAERAGPPGTIAKGAGQIERWTDEHGGDFTLFDSSGLSYENRVTAQGIVRLLWAADDSTWGNVLRRSLPAPGQGTLQGRLQGLRVRAKTGSLTEISALSGWVWLDREGRWAEFSILSSGMPKWTASSLEDRIVRILSSSA